MNNLGDILSEFVIRMFGNTAISFYTDTIIKNWASRANKVAASWHKWPFTEGRASTTYSQEENMYFEGWRHDTIRILTVGGKRYQKLNHEDYLLFREKSPSSDDRVFSDFNDLFFINPNSASGTITAYGQYLIADLDITDHTATTIFSDREVDGNEAILQIMMSYAKTREKKLKESAAHLKLATEMLDVIWRKIGEEQFGYHSKDRGMFERIDVLSGATKDDTVKRDQF